MVQHASPTLPYSGLGFDLGPVAAWAEALTVRFASTTQAATGHGALATEPPTAWGYALLVGLSREIRGR